jgi:acyl-[acyl-carrier-protein]-phospholipid O-acyltransferase / long-chain-fatty-acid--[acyl-carrier-protein] ligase
MAKSQYHLLKTQRFLPLFITQFFNALNDNIFKNALVLLVAYHTLQNPRHEQFLIALMAGIFILPFFLFSATAGQLADKFEKSRLIRIIKLAEIIFMIVASLGFYFNNLRLLITTLFFLGVHSTFLGPLKYSILPHHVHKDELIASNALIEAATFIAILIGQILGGSLILSSHGLPLIITILLAIALLGFISSCFIPSTSRAEPNLKISFTIFRQTFGIISIARQRRDIFAAILAISWFWFIGATFITLLPTFIKAILHANGAVFILFLTLFSLGVGMGSLLCHKLLNGKIGVNYMTIAIIGISFFTGAIYLATRELTRTPPHLLSLGEFLHKTQHIPILLDSLFIAICAGIFVIPLYALIQVRSDEAVRSRIIAGNNIINALFMVASALFILLFTTLKFTIPQLFLILAFSNLFIIFLVPQIR